MRSSVALLLLMVSTGTLHAAPPLQSVAPLHGAHWIAFPADDSDKSPEPAPQLRTEFRLDASHGKITHAILTITGLGCYDCQINGRPISDHLLDPGWTTYTQSVLYNQLDVSPLLQAGDNAIGITLGNGPYNVLRIKRRYTKFAHSFGIPKAVAQLDVTFADGSHAELATNASWKASRGPITFNHQYGGEDYDARLETPGWTSPHFDDRHWQSVAEVLAPGTPDHPAALIPAPQAPDRICETFPPRKITQPRPGVFVYDFGQNMSGWPVLSVTAPAGATMKLIPGELLDKEGLVSQRSSGSPMWFSYTTKGSGAEIWHPQFSYYGFRYLQVTGAVPEPAGSSADAQPVVVPQQPVIHSLGIQFVHADLARVGTFGCSSDTLNRIHALINNAILSNSQSLLTDCPHREKLGWLEQDHLMATAIMMNWDVAGLYTKIENDIADAQHPDGLIPDIAPEYVHFDGGLFDGGLLDSPEWGSTGILAPLYAYQYYGSTKSITDHYVTMKRYADYLAGKAKENIIGYGLGDWYDIGPKPPGPAQLTSTALTCTATWYQDLRALEKIASLLDKPEDAKSFASRAEAVQQAFNDKFFHPESNSYEHGSQTANAMPLALNLVPAANRKAVLLNLIKTIRDNHNRITAGDVGFSYVVRALTDAGEGDLLYDMATQSNGPGYVDQLQKGATTLTEAWDAGPASSQNHLMLGHIESWFYRGLAGIQEDPNSPGFKHFLLRPQFPKELTWVEASHTTPAGTITSSWKREGLQLSCTFDVPKESSATLMVFGTTQELPPGHYSRKFDIPQTQP